MTGGIDREDMHTLIPVHAGTLAASGAGSSGPQGKGWQEGESFTLDSRPVADVVAFGWNKSPSQTMRVDGETTDALQASSSSHPAVAFTQNQAGDVLTNPHMHSLGTNQNATGRNAANVVRGATVRRLMPVETERLMGWPDSWTGWGRKASGEVYKMADGPRYRMCGNGVVANVAEWIGRRIAEVSR